jgi:hypothetical protein
VRQAHEGSEVTLKQRVDQHEREIDTHRREIAAIRKLIFTGMKMINAVAAAQKRNEAALKRLEANIESLANSFRRGTNGHAKRKFGSAMRRIAIILASLGCCAPVFAAITGTVINGTTGQPQAGITVTVLRMTPNGPQPGGSVKADAQGKFSLDGGVEGPTLVRATLDGVTYNHVLAPGMPAEGITLDIYNASKEPGSAKVSKHMILFEPTGEQMAVTEAFIVSNTGKMAWNDPDNGTLHFYVPPTVQGEVHVSATPPGGQPLQQAIQKTNQANVSKINFAMRPGESRVDLTYTVPYKEGAPYAGKVISKDDNTYLIVPSSITMKGDNLNDLGQEPRTQAHLFGLKGTSYQVELTGTVSPRNTEADTNGPANDGQPPIQQIMPRVYSQATVILALALGTLALGFALLYRMPDKETNGRARR